MPAPAPANAIVSSMQDLVDEIHTLLTSTLTNNWTTDSAPTGITSGDAAWSTGSCFVQVQWTTENILDIHQSLSYSGPNNPGSEPGDSGYMSESNFFGVNLVNAEFWGFANDTAVAEDRYFYGVVDIDRSGRFIHFGFGHLEKLYGTWTGGAFKYGGQWGSGASAIALPWSGDHRVLIDSNNDTTIVALSNRSTMRASGLISQAASGDWLVAGNSTTAAAVVDGNGNGIERMDGWSRNGPHHGTLLMVRGNPNNAFVPFVPVQVNYRVDSVAIRRPLGRMRDVRVCNIGNIQPKEIITLGSNEWQFFPYASKLTTASSVMASRNGGIAYRID